MRVSTDKLMVVGIVIFSLVEGLTHFGQAYPDSPGYVSTAHLFQGREALVGSADFRLLRPVIPFLASIVNYFVNIRFSFAIVNLILWCAAAVVMFYFTKLLTKDSYSSLFSAALFTSAIPMLLFGDAVLTDMGGYFFILLGIFLVVKWDIPRAPIQRVCLASLILAVGVLTRESVASVLIFAVAWTILSNRTRGSLARAAILFVIPLAIALSWSYIVGVSYTAWYSQGGLAFAAAHQHLSKVQKILRFVGSVQYSFGRFPEVLALAGLGLLAVHDRNKLKIQISIWIGALAIIFAWPIIDTRFTFILFPSIFPLAGAGLEEAYKIIFRSKLVQEIWPSFPDSPRSRYMFLLLVLGFYALVTNITLKAYASFPWMPYTDPSVKLTDIA